MSLEVDTKASFSDFAARVANDEVDIVVLLGGNIIKDKDGKDEGIQASNIADGDADAMAQLLARFLEPFAEKNPKGATLILATMLQQMINDRYGAEATVEDIAKALIGMIKSFAPETH